MKKHLAPTYSQLIDQNYICWFKKSNSYIIINEILNSYLTNYLAAKDKSQFLKELVNIGKLKNGNPEAETVEEVQ